MSSGKKAFLVVISFFIIIVIFILIELTSDRKKPYFLTAKDFDSSQYISLRVLDSTKRTEDNSIETENYYLFPIGAKSDYGFMCDYKGEGHLIIYSPDHGGLLKLNKFGHIVDYYQFYLSGGEKYVLKHDYLLHKEHYLTWAIDADKEEKKYHDINADFTMSIEDLISLKEQLSKDQEVIDLQFDSKMNVFLYFVRDHKITRLIIPKSLSDEVITEYVDRSVSQCHQDNVGIVWSDAVSVTSLQKRISDDLSFIYEIDNIDYIEYTPQKSWGIHNYWGWKGRLYLNLKVNNEPFRFVSNFNYGREPIRLVEAPIIEAWEDYHLLLFSGRFLILPHKNEG